MNQHQAGADHLASDRQQERQSNHQGLAVEDAQTHADVRGEKYRDEEDADRAQHIRIQPLKVGHRSRVFRVEGAQQQQHPRLPQAVWSTTLLLQGEQNRIDLPDVENDGREDKQTGGEDKQQIADGKHQGEQVEERVEHDEDDQHERRGVAKPVHAVCKQQAQQQHCFGEAKTIL